MEHVDRVPHERVHWPNPSLHMPLNLLIYQNTAILAYLNQLGVSSLRLGRFEVVPSRLLVAKEGRHGLFRGILILLDTLLNSRLGLDLGLDFLGWGR